MISPCDERVVPWKNGLGFTRELFMDPAGSDFKTEPFLFRVSSAKIVSAGDFSLFPDHDRLLMILNGNLRLKHGNDDWIELKRLTWHQFAGADQSKCELINDEAVEDLNVIYDKKLCSANAQILRSSSSVEVFVGSFLFLLEGECDPSMELSRLYRVDSAGDLKCNNATIVVMEMKSF